MEYIHDTLAIYLPSFHPHCCAQGVRQSFLENTYIHQKRFWLSSSYRLLIFPYVRPPSFFAASSMANASYLLERNSESVYSREKAFWLYSLENEKKKKKSIVEGG